MACSHCGSEYEPGSLYCRECRYLFFGEPIQGPIPDEDERILRLAEICESLITGDIDVPKFHEHINEFTLDQERREQEIMMVFANVPVGMEEDFREEIDIGFQGVEACRQALSQLAEFDPALTPPMHMLKALMLFYQGTWAVKEAMRINRRNRGRPIWI